MRSNHWTVFIIIVLFSSISLWLWGVLRWDAPEDQTITPPHFMQALEAPLRVSRTTDTGLYIVAQAAARAQDMQRAANAITYAISRKPDDATLLATGVHYSLRAGNVEKAIEFAKQLHAIHTKPTVEAPPADTQTPEATAEQPQKPTTKQAEDISPAPAPTEPFNTAHPVSYLLLTLDAIKKQDYASAQQYIKVVSGNAWNVQELHNIIYRIMALWIKAEQVKAGVETDPQLLKAVKAIPTTGDLAQFLRFHKALLLAHLGEYAPALEELKQLESQVVILPRRVMELYANIAHAAGETALADALLQRFWDKNHDIWLQPKEIEDYLREYGNQLAIQTASDAVAELLYGAASLVRQQGLDGLSYEMLYSALYLKPDFPIAHVLLGAFLERDQQYQTAISHYKNITADSPFYLRVQGEIAQLRARIGDTDEAVEQLKALQKHYPESFIPPLHLADTLRQEEDYKNAIGYYTEALEKSGKIHSYHWLVYFMRGICHERLKQMDAAEQDFKAALELSPDNPEVINYMAYTWLDMDKNIDQAFVLLRKAASMQPYEGHIIDSLAWAHYKRGEYAEALLYMERAIELLADDAIVNEHLGDVYYKLGRKYEALYQWQRALYFEPESEEQTERLQQKISGERTPD